MLIIYIEMIDYSYEFSNGIIKKIYHLAKLRDTVKYI